VTTPGGTSAGNAWDDFTYLAAPTVSKVSPKPGSIRRRGCHHSILDSFPVEPLVFGSSHSSAAWNLGLERPFPQGVRHRHR
jgi:hypothetical protein